MAIQIISDQIKDANVTSTKLANNAVTPAKADLSSVWSFTAIPSIGGLTPAASGDLVNKAYVDAKINGLHWKESVRVRSTSNVDISDAPATIDGISMAANDRVLLTGQSAGAENGIYIWASDGGAMSRAADADTFQELNGAAVFVREGTSANEGYQQSAELSSFSSQSWILFTSSGAGRQAGTFLSLSSNTLNVDFDNSSIGVNGSDQLFIKASGVGTAEIADNAVTNAKLEESQVTYSAGSGLTGGGAVALGGSATFAVQAANATISVGAGGIQVGTIAASNIAANAITTGSVTDASITLAKLANVPSGKILVGNASNRPVDVTPTGDLTMSDSGAFTIVNNAITGAKIADGEVANNKLANSSVTISGSDGIDVAGGALALGGSKSIGLTLDGSSLQKSASGLKINNLGVGTAQIADSAITGVKIADGEVANGKLASATINVVAGNGLSTTDSSIDLGGSATLSVNLDGGSLAVGGSGLKVSDGGIAATQLATDSVTADKIAANSVGASELADNAVDSAALASDAVIIDKCGFRAYTQAFSGTTATKYDLGRAVDLNFFDRVQVFRNGLRCKKVGSSPADSSEYTVANDGTGSVCAITFGAAPNSDSIIVDYLT
jgi:hypothetical protein